MLGCEIIFEDFDVTENPLLFERSWQFYRKKCHEEGVEESLKFDYNDENCRYIVAQLSDNETILGTCRLSVFSAFVIMERIAICEEYRKLDVGKQICQRAIQIAESSYSTKILVTYSRPDTFKFYNELGFEAVFDNDFTDAGFQRKTMIYIPRWDRLPALDLWKNVILKHEYIPNECSHPTVLEKIKEKIILFKEQKIPRLMHLQHLLDQRVIGRSIVRVYRECARATLNQNYARSKELEVFITAIAWEKLNTGHYAEVEEAWRELYSSSLACRAVRLKCSEHIQEALHACDLGLIMGRDVDNSSLSKFANHLHSCLPQSSAVVSLKVQKVVEPPTPLPNSTNIYVIDRPSFEEMFKCMKEQKPVVVKGLVSQWPAFLKWSFSYFNETIGHRTVPIEIGSSYADSGWKQTLMTFREFMEKFVENENADGPGYLAQHRLFDQIPELLDDIIVPDYCAFGKDGIDNVDMNIWIGPAKTVSPLHSDPKDNIFCQVVGRKFIRIVPLAESKSVYPREDGFLTRTSQVDVRNPDLLKFPLFREAHVFDCTLNAGECLYIPSGFWHYVLALDPSISVSCWFATEL